MAGVEVAYALRNKTDYLLASSAELLSPGFVPIYAHTLPSLMRSAQGDSVEVSLRSFALQYMSSIHAHVGPSDWPPKVC